MRPDAHQTLAGRSLDGRFLAVSRLDRGGFGAVYEGVDRETGQVVALKVLHPHLSGDSKHVARLRREAEIIAALDHPHVVRVIGFFDPEGAPAFLAMELLGGQSLQDRLRAGPMTVADAATTLDQLLDALDAVHRSGVVHRDLKPANVFLLGAADGPPRVKLLDFGVAKMVDGDTADRLTRTGVAIGTPRYMAPEQALAEPVGPHTDIWAAGLVAYAMLTGHPPWSGRSGLDITRALLDAGPVSLDGLGPPVPEPLVSLVRRAVAKDPHGRFADAGAMRHALRTGQIEPLEASLVTSPRGWAARTSGALLDEGTAETAIERPGISPRRSGAPDSPPGTVASAGAPPTVVSAPAPAPVALGSAPPTAVSVAPPPTVSSVSTPSIAVSAAPPATVSSVGAPVAAAPAPPLAAAPPPRGSGRWRVLLGCAAAGILIGGVGAAVVVLSLRGEGAPIAVAPNGPAAGGPVAVAPLPLDPTAPQPMMPTATTDGTAPAPSSVGSEEGAGVVRGERAPAVERGAAARRAPDPAPSPDVDDEAPDLEPEANPGQGDSVTVASSSSIDSPGRRPGPPSPSAGPILTAGAHSDPATPGPAVRFSILSTGTVPQRDVQLRILPRLSRVRACWATAGLTAGARIRQVATLHLDPIGFVRRVEVSGEPRGARCVEVALLNTAFTHQHGGEEVRLELASN